MSQDNKDIYWQCPNKYMIIVLIDKILYKFFHIKIAYFFFAGT